MVQSLIVKWVFKAVMNAIQKKHNLKKMDDYVNKENILDKQMRSVNKSVGKYGKYIEKLEKEVAILKANSHAPQEYICCRKYGCKIAKTKNKKLKKKEK